MNVFGGQVSSGKAVRGPRGFRGEHGRSGIIDMAQFLPNSVLHTLQVYDEEGCFRVEDLNKDIKKDKGKIVEWLSRSATKHNLASEMTPPELVDVLPSRHALAFQNTRLVNDNMPFLTNDPITVGFICITFKVTSFEEQVLVSSFDDPDEDFKEIQVSRDTIIIHYGEGEEIIQHMCTEWTTLYIGYHALLHQTLWDYIIDNDPRTIGSFTSKSILGFSPGMAVGSRYDGDYPFKGEISNIEVYHTSGQNSFPDPVKNIVISKQLMKL